MEEVAFDVTIVGTLKGSVGGGRKWYTYSAHSTVTFYSSYFKNAMIHHSSTFTKQHNEVKWRTIYKFNGIRNNKSYHSNIDIPCVIAYMPIFKQF